jgi:hypothetical protein
VAAVIVLAIVGVCGGSSLAILNGLSLPGATTDLRFPIGNGLTGAAGTETAGAGGNNGGSGTGGTSAGGPGATQTSGSPATPTLEPTVTTVPLAFSGNLVLQDQGFSCVGTMTITNDTGQAISWTWVPSGKPGDLKSFLYTLNPSDSSGGWAPHHNGMPSGSTDTLTVHARCSGGPWHLALQDSAGGSQSFTLSIASGG